MAHVPERMEDMSSYAEGQTHQLVDRLEAEGFTADHITKLGQFDRLDLIKSLLDGGAEIRLIPKSERMIVEVMIDSIVRIDRSVKPTYPSWMKEARKHGSS